MATNTALYPLGIQTFEDIIQGGYVYIDKTEYVYRMTRSRYIFLSRPRRFGKSLLTSTLECYFEGRRELFKGLAIETLEKDWEKYPVLHFDLSRAKNVDKNTLESMLDVQLYEYEKIYGMPEKANTVNDRFSALIKAAHGTSNNKVVVLIDEYDAPLLDVVHEEENLKDLRNVMRNFYSPLKACDRYLRFVFLTGITKFSQLSIFSELNNIKNISMDKNYAGICGITEEELLTQLDAGIEALAQENEVSHDEAFKMLKDNYDGYHFTWPSPDVYNPFSLLNSLADREIDSYWFGSGTPTYLIEMLRKFNISPSELGGTADALRADFDAPTERMTSIIPLLYQSGYTTIKDYDKLGKVYTLGIPNNEIRIGLMHSLLPNYLGSINPQGNTTAARMGVALYKDDIDGMFNLLKKFLGIIPGLSYVNKAENYEAHWQQMLYIIFSLIGAYCDVEVQTPTGRVDMVARTERNLYLIELKLNKSAEAAMEQINLNDYAQRFALSGLPVVKVGVNFDQETRNITWQIEK